MNGLIGYSEPTCSPATYAREQMVRTPTVKERLALAVEHAEERLAAAKRAKEIFDKYPDIEELLNIMQRGSF